MHEPFTFGGSRWTALEQLAWFREKRLFGPIACFLAPLLVLVLIFCLTL